MSNHQSLLALCPPANKRQRTEDNGHPSTLKRRLYALLKEGDCTDVELVVTTNNGEAKRLPAHKTILVAMSPVIATKMKDRWGEGGHGRSVIEIPGEVGVDSVELFLEFLYTEELNKKLNTELWLELLFLADHYEVEDLIILCDKKLIKRLNLENCIKVYEKAKLFQGVKCGNSAFKLIQKTLSEILEKFSNYWLQMDASTWKAILELNYLPNVEEIALFKGLKRWKEENVEERAENFKELVQLIRFPLLGIRNFAEFVVPSKELDPDLIIQMFVYFAEIGPIPEQFENCQQRNLLEPKNSEELQEFITESQSGDIIELNGTYSSFKLPDTKDNLTIRGKKGGEAIINGQELGIAIYGKQCKIDGLSILSEVAASRGIYLETTANQTILQNITITGASIGMIINGNKAVISNISIINPTDTGIRIFSSHNKISNCSIIINDEDAEAVGFIIRGGHGNKLNNFKSTNATFNKVESKGNIINGLEISGKTPEFGLTVMSRDNIVENLSMIGEDSVLRVSAGSQNITVNACRCDKIIIEGESHKINDSKVKELQVEGRGHVFNNCEGGLLYVAAGTEMTSNGCLYHSVEHQQLQLD